jgi:hypothetical protein
MHRWRRKRGWRHVDTDADLHSHVDTDTYVYSHINDG